MTVESIARALKARRSGSAWMARCPAHDDANPSLGLRAADGKILLHCYAGCTQRDVIEALKARGLWEPSREGQNMNRRIVATYDYTDESGELLYQVVRYEPKDFRQRHPDGRGGWIWKKGPRQVLYRLREALEAPIVFVTEGEKDAETLRSHGFVATTNAGGSNAHWLPAYTQTLCGHEVVLIPDKDAPGRQRVLRIARALLGHAAKITVWEPDDLRAKDVTDWFALGHSELQLIHEINDVQVKQ
jgi:DNA primase